MLVNYYVIALMLRVKFMKYTRGIGGRKKKYRISLDVLWKKCFLLKSWKRKKRSLWNTLQHFGTHTEQFHFRAFSRLFQWMLPNERNLHWKFLQEHRPFHVSQLGSLAFIPELLLLPSLFLCPQPILSGSYTSSLPSASTVPVTYSASKPYQKRLCSHNLSVDSGTHLFNIWSSRKVHFSKHSAWKNPHWKL